MSETNETDMTEEFDGNIAALDMEAGEPTSVGSYHNLTELEDIGHPLVPEMGHSYYNSNISGDISLQKVLTTAMADKDFSSLLIGETGAGKNMAIKKVCAMTNRPMVRVNFGIDVTYDELVGHYAPKEGGGWGWMDGILTKAVKNGWVFVADELNAASGEATMPLHGITEDAENRELVIRETGQIIDPHPEFNFVATANPISYAGTQDINAAFKGRFFTIRVDYMGEEDEQDLLLEKTNIDNNDASDLVALASKLRESHSNGDLLTPVSTRDLIKIGKFNDIMSLYEAAHMILGGIAEPTDKSVISKMIDMHLSSGSGSTATEDDFGYV